MKKSIIILTVTYLFLTLSIKQTTAQLYKEYKFCVNCQNDTDTSFHPTEPYSTLSVMLIKDIIKKYRDRASVVIWRTMSWEINRVREELSLPKLKSNSNIVEVCKRFSNRMAYYYLLGHSIKWKQTEDMGIDMSVFSNYHENVGRYYSGIEIEARIQKINTARASVKHIINDYLTWDDYAFEKRGKPKPRPKNHKYTIIVPDVTEMGCWVSFDEEWMIYNIIITAKY